MKRESLVSFSGLFLVLDSIKLTSLKKPYAQLHIDYVGARLGCENLFSVLLGQAERWMQISSPLQWRYDYLGACQSLIAVR